MWQTAFGVVLGFLLSKLGDLWKEHRSDKKTSTSVRTLISLETERNKGSRVDYWTKVGESHETWSSQEGEFSWGELASSISGVPFPVLPRRCWESNLQYVAAVYSESEIETYWELYAAFSKLETLWGHLVKLDTDRKESAHRINMQGDVGGGVMGHMISTLDYAENAIPRAKEFCKLIEGVVGKDICTFNNIRPNKAPQPTPPSGAAER